MTARKPYPSDASDEEWALVAPYLTLLREDAAQREHPLHEVFNALRYLLRYGVAWRAMPNDLPPGTAPRPLPCKQGPASAIGRLQLPRR